MLPGRYRSLYLLIALLSSVLLAGCNAFRSTEKSHVQSSVLSNSSPLSYAEPITQSQPEEKKPFADAPVASVSKDAETSELERCKAQLDALRTLSPEKYPKLNGAFRYIMTGASNYASVRAETNHETQETIDALYKYRSKLICAQIDQAMMNSLSLHGAMPQ